MKTRMRYVFALVTSLILVTLLFLLLPTASSATETQVFLEAPAQVSQGNSFSVSVSIQSVTAFDAGQFDLWFDEALVVFDTATSGSIGGTEIPVDLWNKLGTGHYRFICNVPAFPGVSGSGSLATLHFDALAPGSVELRLTNGFINNNLAIEIPAVWSNDTVVVTGALTGDVNGDGRINSLDMILVGQHWNATGSAGWIPEDVNKDGVVNVLDALLIGQKWTG